MDTEKMALLKELGLSQNEAKVYLAAIELGPSLHKTLADKAGVKRPTLYYEALPLLVEKGLLVETVRGKRKYLVPQDLQPYLESRKQLLEKAGELVPQLRTLLAAATTKPVLILYEGVEGIKKVYADHLAQREPILELVGIENIRPELQIYIQKYYIPERTRRRIPLRMLISGPTAAGIFKVKSEKYELREARTLDGKLLPIPLGCNVYGDTVSLTLHREDSEPVGLIIRSQEIATALRSIFEFLWSGAKEAQTTPS